MTPYTGGNLGDAAIQDALISNFRERLPGARFSGITLNCDNFTHRHGAGAFPLCANRRPLYAMSYGTIESAATSEASSRGASKSERFSPLSSIKTALKRVPLLGQCLKAIYRLASGGWRELRHCVGGYRFLTTQDLLIVSGGGQLDEEWGGPWGHPYALFKWTALARIARVPCAFASVGACKAGSAISRLFLSAALSTAKYRSYRDKNSKQIASVMLRRASQDGIVPDIAFSLPPSELPPPVDIRILARGRTIVAISPIAYAKPGIWPCPDAAVHERYLQQMTRIMVQLLDRDYFVALVCSSVGDDDQVISELLSRLPCAVDDKRPEQLYVPKISTWKDLAASLQGVDFLIASRLHSAILGFITLTPTIAISFDPKVDWIMEDLGQTDYLLQIKDFTAEGVIQALERIELHKCAAIAEIDSYQRGVLSTSAMQYDALSELALASHRLPS